METDLYGNRPAATVYAEVEAGLGVSWSPDGTDSRLAFNSSEKRKVKIIDFATKNVTTLANGKLPDWRRH